VEIVSPASWVAPEMRATTTGWLTDINAAGRKLNNDIREVPSGLG
jgi:hypothetical protein